MMIETVRNDDSFPLDIDLVNLSREETDTPQHLAGWIYNRCEIKVAGRHLVKHGREQEKVLAIDEGYLD
jgi:hypothetical protein